LSEIFVIAQGPGHDLDKTLDKAFIDYTFDKNAEELNIEQRC